MSSESELENLTQLGHDIGSLKYYAISVAALWAYDYLLTFEDEVRYAWKTGNVLMFVLFLFIRYLPLPFIVWMAISFLDPNYTFKMYVCEKTVFIEVVYYTLIHVCAQIFLTRRTYAITRKNKWIAGILYTISAAQFGVGVYMFVSAALRPVAWSTISLRSFQLCLIIPGRTVGIVHMVIPLIFDIMVFVFVIVQMRFIKSTCHGVNVSTLLTRVNRDTEIYFVAISSSHLLNVIMISVARPGLRAVPIVGSAVVIPVMITRMIISLKKVASSGQPHASTDVLQSGLPTNLRDIYSFRPTDSMQLSVFKN